MSWVELWPSTEAPLTQAHNLSEEVGKKNINKGVVTLCVRIPLGSVARSKMMSLVLLGKLLLQPFVEIVWSVGTAVSLCLPARG